MSFNSTRRQSSVVRSNPRAVGISNLDCAPSPTPPQVPPRTLPVELWMKIIHKLGNREWIVLCRVCWLLYQIAQPCLYENVALRFWKNPRSESSDGRVGDFPQFKRTIDHRPELGAHIRSLALHMDDKREPNNHRKGHLLLLKLYLFPNLERLDVRRIHFDLELCNILHSHPRLKSVTVFACTLDKSLDVARIDQDHFPHSSISTVEVLYPEHDPLVHAWAALAPAKLKSLTVRSVISSSPEAGLILNRIRELNKTSFLKTLSLDIFSPVVIRFLIASPQLRYFKLNFWDDGYNLISSSLPADAIPCLEEYDGPAEISSTFIRGRPVHTVKFAFSSSLPEDRLVEIIISLQYSTVPLTSLTLDFWNITLGSWLSHIPVTVRYLRLDYLDWLYFEKWLPALSHLASLHTFSCRFGRTLHREGVLKISDVCPSLREIDNGRYKWFIGRRRVWERYNATVY